MKTLTSTYSETEKGWVSEDLALTGNIHLDVKLKEKGIIIIKKRNSADGSNPKISISSRTDYGEYLVNGSANGKILQVLTSTAPEYIQYENIK